MKPDFEQKIQQLGALFSERDVVFLEKTKKILDFLKPTLLDAVIEFFNVEKPQEQIEWQSIDVIEGGVVIYAILYKPDDALPDLQEDIQEMLDELQDELQQPIMFQQIIKLIVPTYMIFENKEVIKKWLQATYVEINALTSNVNASSSEQKEPLNYYIAPSSAEKQDNKQEFDMSKLSKEQIAQLLFFQDAKGTKKQ